MLLSLVCPHRPWALTAESGLWLVLFFLRTFRNLVPRSNTRAPAPPSAPPLAGLCLVTKQPTALDTPVCVDWIQLCVWTGLSRVCGLDSSVCVEESVFPKQGGQPASASE